MSIKSYHELFFITSQQHFQTGVSPTNPELIRLEENEGGPEFIKV